MDDTKTISELQKKHCQQLANNRDKVKARKARTRRLIQRGAIAESMIAGAEEMSNDEFARTMREMMKS